MENLAYLMHELKVRAVKENVQYLEVMATSPGVPTDCCLGAEYAKLDKRLKDCVKSGTYGEDLQKVFNEILDLFYKNADTVVGTYIDFIHKLDELSNELESHLRDVDTNKVVWR